MDRPVVICHMMTSLDGKIIGDYMNTAQADFLSVEYERLHDTFHARAWMCGRITMEENFTLWHPPELDSAAPPVAPTDYVADRDAKSYAVAVDPSGKLGWKSNVIADGAPNRPGAHIIEVLTEQVPPAYVAYLHRLGISYIFAGKEQLCFTQAVTKLKTLFGIDKLVLEGGGVLNGSFMSEDLIDELSIVLAPVADGATDTPTLFEKSAALPLEAPMEFSLDSVEQLGKGGLWLRYTVKRQGGDSK